MGEGLSKIEAALLVCLNACMRSPAPFATASKLIDRLEEIGWSASDRTELRDRVVKELLRRQEADLPTSN